MNWPLLLLRAERLFLRSTWRSFGKYAERCPGKPNGSAEFNRRKRTRFTCYLDRPERPCRGITRQCENCSPKIEVLFTGSGSATSGLQPTTDRSSMISSGGLPFQDCEKPLGRCGLQGRKWGFSCSCWARPSPSPLLWRCCPPRFCFFGERRR